MSYLGREFTKAPLSTSDIPDDSITSAKIVAGTVAASDVAADVATQAELDTQRTNSSITTLGTVTAGDLSNTAIVYPDGHVVNTTFKACGAAITLNNASHAFSTEAQGIENLAVTAGNKLAIWFIGGSISTSTNSPEYYSVLIKVNDNSSDTIYASPVYAGFGSDARFDSPSAFVFHTCVGTSIDIMYGIEGFYASSGYYFYLKPLQGDSTGQHAGDDTGMRFCVQEIQA